MLRHLENKTTQKESPLCVSTIRRQPLLTIRSSHTYPQTCVCVYIQLIFLTKLMLSKYKLFSFNKHVMNISQINISFNGYMAFS